VNVKLKYLVYRVSLVKLKLVIGLICLSSGTVFSQQFAGDNQWVAPHGVATLVGTFGQRYMMLDVTVAVIQEWEFNLQATHYYKDPRNQTTSYTSPSFYIKRRLWQNKSETAGYALFAGTGIYPQHLDQEEVTSTFRSWWAMGVATFAFAENKILWDILPGVVANLDHKQSGDTAWGFSYSSRVAVYKIIPSSAIVAEVFGTAGDASSPISYRAGVRWESKHVIIAGTYSDSFDGSIAAGLEIGIVVLTNKLWGKNKE
ncbi:hypothetical protein, partial [Algoriphagus sp.]|uniref:hypothetical protein n=1 Tax=Algoriphagus sp. TaxID=1872435 RepID=UPI0025D348BD